MTSATPPSRGLLVLALAIVLFLAALDQTVVGTALPQIAGELGGLDWYTWVFTAYMLATTAVIPVAGKLGDLYGRRRLLVIGLLEFLLSSMLAGLVSSMEMLVLMRALQGVGAGILAANAQAAVGDLFPPAEIGKYNGMLSGVYALASLVGPVLGGAITDGIGWRWVFLVNLPVGLLALLVVLRRFRPVVSVRPVSLAELDVKGALLLVLTLVAALASLAELDRAIEGPLWPVGSTAAVALVLGLLFVRHERRTSAAIVPLHLLTDRELRLTLTITTLSGLAVYTAAIFTPLMLQGALELSPSAAGLAMTPMVFALVAGGVLGGIVVSKTGHYRTLITLGLLLGAGAAVLLAAAAKSSVMITAGGLALLGLGVGMTIPALLSAAQNAASYAELGVATSLSKFARSFGGIIGLGLLGAALHLQIAARLRDRLPALLGHADDQLSGLLASDPSAVLAGEATLAEQPALAGDPELIRGTLELLREALAHATAGLLWAVAVALLLAALASLRLRDVPLRRTFDKTSIG